MTTTAEETMSSTIGSSSRAGSPASASEASLPSSSSRSTSPFIPDPADMAAYADLMSSRLGDAVEVVHRVAAETAAETQPQSAAALQLGAVNADADDADDTGTGRPMTKAEKLNAKKKRRKERERALRAAAEAARAAAEPVVEKVVDEVVPFRLFSAVRGYTLTTREDYPIPPNPRLRPLPGAKSERLRAAAASAARSAEHDRLVPTALRFSDGETPHADGTSKVSSSGSTSLAHAPTRIPPAPSLPTLTFTAHHPTPPAFVAILPDRPTPTRCVYFPAVELDAAASGAAPKRKTRRRRRVYDRPWPGLWRPEPGTGGKSAGYAYGWGG